MDNTMDYGADILTLVDDDGVEHQFEVADTMDYEDPSVYGSGSGIR